MGFHCGERAYEVRASADCRSMSGLMKPAGEVADRLEPADFLMEDMRGPSSIWYRIRIICSTCRRTN